MKAAAKNLVLILNEDSRSSYELANKLSYVGYRTEIVQDIEYGMKQAKTNYYGAIILKCDFFEMSGNDICKSLRQQGVSTPILMISGSSETFEIIRCLELGADDCMPTPFSYNELIARLGALIRRNYKSFATRWIRKNSVELDTATLYIRNGSASKKLTNKEMLLLKRLMQEAPEPISRHELLQDVWGIDALHTSNRLDVYIRRLRAKLDSIGRTEIIKTSRGHGYFFVVGKEDQ